MENKLTRLWRNLKAAAYAAVNFDTMNHDMVRRLFGGGYSSAGKVVNESTALTLSAVWACQRVLSETIGALPWGVYKRDPEGNLEKAPEHPMSRLLYAPNADMTGEEFREALVLNLCQSGNAYSYVDRLGGELVTSLYPLPSSKVQPARRADGTVYYKVLNAQGIWQDEPRERIWHVKGFGNDGLVGLSPLAAAREAIGFALAAEEFGSKFFAQGGKPSGFVTVPNFFTPDQRKIARENLNQLVGGMANAHKFALFEGGMKLEPWASMPLNDMEFLLLRKFSVDEICRFYRVPPHMVAQLDKATFSNIEQQSQEFANYSLIPYLTRIEASWSRWLLSPADQATYVLKFNLDGLLRGDSAARAALYPVMLQNGVMTRNEVRAKENLNRSDDAGMDDHTVQEQMVPVSMIEALLDSKIQKNKAPPPAPFGGGKPPNPSAEPKTLVIQSAPGPTVDLNITPEALKGLTETLTANVMASTVETLAAVKRSEEAAQRASEAVQRATIEAAEATKRVLEENTKALVDATVFAMERSEEHVKEMGRVARLPRKAIIDSKGDVIGSEVVDQLH